MFLLSDGVTNDDRADYGALAIAILDMLCMYDRILDCIAWFARDSLRGVDSHHSGLTFDDFLTARDGEHGKLFVRLAASMEVPGDRTNVVAVFNRLKSTRDHVAHASAMNAMTDDGAPVIGIPYYNAKRNRVASLDGNQSSITPHLVEKRLSDAAWLMEQIDWCRVWLRQHGGPFSLDVYLPPAAPKVAPPALPPRVPLV